MMINAEGIERVGDTGYEVKIGAGVGALTTRVVPQCNSGTVSCGGGGRRASCGSQQGEGAEAAGDLQSSGAVARGRARHQLEMSHHLMSAGRLSITWSAPGRTSSN